MLRAWGGGIYEQDAFYDTCDELGICVWQDFMFACATYPTYDADWMRGVEAEARDNIRRLRHHPCIALWCGYNEVELSFFIGEKWDAFHMTWEDYGMLFDRLLPELVKELDPGRDYWPGSPHSPCGDRMDSGNPACGDAHLWDVWHGRRPFEWYRTATHRFVSEFGFQSFPEPRTVRSFTRPEDRNVVSRIMEHHQRSDIGNSTILSYMLDWFRLPPKFDDMLWLSQILQGMAMKYAVEHWRRLMPRCMGSLYWQFNDCWPVASWASMDSLGRWKALHHMARRFYAPLLVSGVEDLKRGEVAVFVSSDLVKAASGSVTWRVMTVGGETLATGTRRLRIPPCRSIPCGTVPLAGHLRTQSPRDLIVSLALEVAGETVSDNLVLLARPKHMDLERPTISTQVRALSGGAFAVRMKADKPALWTWLELGNTDARYSDNFFALMPGTAVEVTVQSVKAMGLAAFRKQLRVRSLVDTY
jgi:beta-mannosidase